MSDSTRSVTLGPRVDRRVGLSTVQTAIWTSQRLAGDAPLANMATAHRISASIDPARFTRAFNAVARASDTLRTVVDDRPGRSAEGLVLHSPPRRVEVIDVPAAELDTWIAERIETPIDATVAAYDGVLIRHADDDWTWWLDLHHIVTDAWSSMLVFDALSAAYAADADEIPPLPSLPEAPGRGRASQGRADDGGATTGGDHHTSPDTWDVVEQGGSITPYGPRGLRTTTVTRHNVDISLTQPPDRFRTFSAELTSSTLVAAATAATLARLDGRRPVVLGVPVHHRSGPAARAVIGPLMAVCPMAVHVDLDESFADLFDRVHRSLLTTVRRARTLDPPDTAFDAVVNVQTATYGDFAGLPTTSTWHRSSHVESAHPIRVHAYDYGAGLGIDLDLNASLSLDDSHLAFPDHLEHLLQAALADPDVIVGDVDLLGPDEHRALAALNPPAFADGFDEPVHLVIGARLRAEPDLIVAEHGEVEMTARELDARAEQLAGALVGAGVGVGDRVGVRLPRSIDVLVAIHGVLRSGGAFVMLDPDDPTDRHEAIISDAGIAIVIDSFADVVDGQGDHTSSARPDVSPEDLAYIIYTSGSTGQPKGVPISHRGLSDYLSNSVDAYPVRRGSDVVMPLHSALVFDLSITSLFLPQLMGGRTVVVSGDPVTALGTIATDPRITVLKATPSQLEILVRLATGPLSLEVVIVGGEAFRTPVARAVADLAHGVRIFNEYGPAEAVVGCMLHEWDPTTDDVDGRSVDVPIGIATPGAEIHVLDARGCPTPPGAWGELYVWRTGMAAGYLGLPDATREKFAPVDGLGPRVRYRTGDRVRMSRGVLVYGGRADDQLSVSGVRLEPGEIEAALVSHPEVTTAVVRLWSPGASTIERCARCGLGTDVPGVAIDERGICSVCRDFDKIEPQTRSWFRTSADLDAALVAARQRALGDVDCLHLLSGGKDSTYALYQLVERGWRVHALTLDNGFISDGAKENVRRSIADLGITHEFVTTNAMDEIFRDSLDRFANVCNGCYKTIYTLATARAHEMGIPVIVTGLSRGQFFETRLIPHQFEADRFDPDAIDRTVLQARRAYHATRDAVTDLLPEQEVFDRTDIDVLSEIEYLDFYRYVDVELSEMYDFLENRAPWVRPADTGRSTNCLVNVAGIHTHQTERGYHNYAEPYSWDVRLGHKTRAEALDELDDDIDPAEIEPMLDQIGYQPRRPEVLTAWYQTRDGQAIDTRLLSAHLREILPSRSIPTAYVHVDDLPLADSTKLDVRALPAPMIGHLGSAAYVEPATPTEAAVADIWSAVLDVERVGAEDDFFDLGGASLAALETVAATERRFGVELPDALVFEHRRVRQFALAVDDVIGSGERLQEIPPLDPTTPPPLSPGEEAMLFEYRAAPGDARYNGMRHYRLPVELDVDRLREAIHTVVERHQPLHTAYDEPRTRLAPARAATVELLPDGPLDEFLDRQRAVPFDLDNGPLVRTHIGAHTPGTTDVVVAMHHISVDAGTFDQFWNEVDAAYHDGELPQLAATYAAHAQWQRSRIEPGSFPVPNRDIVGASLPPLPPHLVEPDGYLHRPATLTASELRSSAGTTPFGAALTATAVVLGAFSRDDVVQIGITSSTKDHPATDALVGYFLNSLPLVVDVDAEASLAAVESAANDLVAAALPRRTEPFAEMVRAARHDGRRVPDISHMLAYERLAPSRFGDADVELRIVMAPTAINELTFFVHEQGDNLSLGLEYRGNVVAAATAYRLLDAFDRVLTALCRTPGISSATARAALQAPDLVGPPLDPEPASPVRRALQLAATHPTDIAVVESDGSTTTYVELARRSAAMASALHAAGAAQSRIGVSLPRSADLLATIIGIGLAGGVYVPIDPALPASRVDALIEGAELGHAVVDTDASAPLRRLTTIDVSTIETDPTAPLPTPDSAPADDRPAYVIFTSGSTGTPAAVEVSHGNLAASTAARSVFYGPQPPRRFLVTPSIGFDSSMVGIFWPLATGGSVVVPADADVHDVDRLGDLIAELDVSHVLMVPSLYRALLDRRHNRLGRLHTAIVAGEACHADLVRRHARLLPQVELVNEYGPTEATVWATAHRCEALDDPVPIGIPVAGTRLRVADDRQRPLATGARGELLISGPGVVAGYGSARSNDAFVSDGERSWYRTGDLVHVDERGRVHFDGRVDDQLNVGGLRLEPLEIEGVIRAADGVDDVVVTAQEVDGRMSLVAHTVGAQVDGLDQAIRTRVADHLGATAVPRRIVWHDCLPRTQNGKLDRDAALRLDVSSEPAALTGVANVDGAETPGTDDRVVEIWRSVLSRPDLDDDGDFFEAGGDSLAAVAVVTALGDLVGRDVPVAALLTSPTPRSMGTSLGLDPTGPSVQPASGRRPVVTSVTLRAGLPGGPVVLMTPAWDSVMGYHALAGEFDDDVRVVAVVVTDVDEGSSLLTIPELGDSSIEVALDLLAGNTGRRLAVLGWSIGGVAAYDLGQRLADRGVNVSAIVLVDTFFPGEHHHLWSNRWWKYKSLLRSGSFGEIGRELAVMGRRRVDKLAVRLGRRLMSLGGEPPPERRIAVTGSGVPRSALDGDPSPTEVPVVLLAANTTNPARTIERWRTVASNLSILPIEGRHRGFRSVMGADRVHAITAHLNSILRH